MDVFWSMIKGSIQDDACDVPQEQFPDSEEAKQKYFM